MKGNKLVERLLKLADSHQAYADELRAGAEIERQNAQIGDMLGFDRFAELARKSQVLSKQLAACTDAIAAEAASLAEQEASKLK